MIYGTLSMIAEIGKERKPITHQTAIVGVILYSMIIIGLLLNI